MVRKYTFIIDTVLPTLITFLPILFSVDPVPAQVLIDPNFELKDDIERKPITEAVPEVLPTFVQSPVFVVLPASTSNQDEEPATIMEMQVVNEPEVTTLADTSA